VYTVYILLPVTGFEYNKLVGMQSIYSVTLVHQLGNSSKARQQLKKDYSCNF